MLVDFGEVKGHLRAVCATLDHTCLNDNPAFASSPSAERIARYIFDEMRKLDPAMPLSALEVFETDTSMARYEP